MMQAVLALEAL